MNLIVETRSEPVISRVSTGRRCLPPRTSQKFPKTDVLECLRLGPRPEKHYDSQDMKLQMNGIPMRFHAQF